MCSSVDEARTQEIMARFRPIAPRPEPTPAPPAVDHHAAESQLRSTTCRARKRGRTSLAPAVAIKRHKPLFPVMPLPSRMARPRPHPLSASQLGFSGRGFTSGLTSVVKLPPEKVAGTHTGLVITMSILPERAALVERDLLQGLPKPKVIVPQPLRPVGSSISVVGHIREGSGISGATPPTAKRPDEVEREVESETLPAVVSDSKNRVRLANSAYKEMVGQPECPWLDAMVSAGANGLKPASTRINGEVLLDLPESPVPAGANGFSCKVRIEWASNNGQKTFINALCDVIKLSCESKDYLFAWRFHTSDTSETNCKA